MSNLTKTIKLRINVSPEQELLLQQMTEQYRQACNFVSEHIFDNQFNLAYQSLNKELYSDLRDYFGLKSQLAQSVIKTAIARYKTVKQQLFQNPYKYKDEIATKRHKLQEVRRQLQSKGTKSAKRKLKAVSGRENRWMSDVNHQISKTLVEKYGKDTLFVLEDLTGVSFEESNLSRTVKQKYDLRSWSFYQLEQFLTYKAHENRSEVLKVSAKYTSQRCPKCGTIHKENRDHHRHLYRCQCSYSSNDDRIGAMNIQLLGTMWISGDNHPRYERITTTSE